MTNRSALIRLLIAGFLALFATLGAVPPAQAGDDAAFAETVGALTKGSFKDKAAAVELIAASGHARVVPVLQALKDGLLFSRKSDDAVVIGERVGNEYVLSDAVSGADVGREASRELKKIIANNQMRVQINGLLGGLMLFSASADARAHAAEEILARPDGADVQAVEKALAQETDPGVADKLTLALAAIRLASSDPAVRLVAVTNLTGSADAAIRVMLSNLAANDPDEQVKAAAADAVAAADHKRAFTDVAQNLIFGLSLGSILLLAAAGLAITFGVMGVINMAHGEMIMLGAYTTFAVQEAFRAALPPEYLDYYLIVAAPAAFVVAGLVGIVMERGIIQWLYGRPLETLLATWGVSLALQQVVRSIFGATNREVANPSWMSGSVDLFWDLSITTNRMVIILFGLAVLAILAASIRFTRFGLNMRAVTQNRRMASSMGIPTGWLDALTFGLGSGIAGVAGVALSQVTNVSPNLGQNYIVDSFMVVVFGGVGSLWGVLLGAFSLGVVNKFLEPFSGAMLGKILVLVFIILFIQKRPRGLFAPRGRAFEN